MQAKHSCERGCKLCFVQLFNSEKVDNKEGKNK